MPLANITLGGVAGSRTLTLKSGAALGTSNITITVTDTATPALSTAISFSVTVKVLDLAPIILTNTNYFVQCGAAPSNISIVLSDDLTPANDLVFATPVSSDISLVPASNLSVSGTGGIRTLTVTPLTGKTGNTIISMVCTDSSGNSTPNALNYYVCDILANPIYGFLGQEKPLDISFDPASSGLIFSSVTITSLNPSVLIYNKRQLHQC